MTMETRAARDRSLGPRLSHWVILHYHFNSSINGRHSSEGGLQVR